MSRLTSARRGRRGQVLRVRVSPAEATAIRRRVPPGTTFSAHARMVLLEDKDGLDRAVRLVELRALAEIRNEIHALAHCLSGSAGAFEALPLLLALRRIEGLLAERRLRML